jgi:hypothetical protein
MLFAKLLDRFIEKTPITVMAYGTIHFALNSSAIPGLTFSLENSAGFGLTFRKALWQNTSLACPSYQLTKGIAGHGCFCQEGTQGSFRGFPLPHAKVRF